ncbi:putative l membrane protein [Peptoniphilus sp. ING2-D1G]|nr:putative l membrane protein [Peptoniphilus sp. ING2-D1G]
MAFTVVNIHMQADITEGGILGLTLFLYKIFNLDPSYVSPILDFLCFAAAMSLFGKNFLKKTAVASVAFALFYKIFLSIGAFIPNLYNFPIIAAIIGGIGIGIGCGLVVTEGGAAGGDDALALMLSHKFKINLSKAYLFSDFVILALSLAYIPFGRIFFSLLTTFVSSILIGQFEINPKGNTQNQTA